MATEHFSDQELISVQGHVGIDNRPTSERIGANIQKIQWKLEEVRDILSEHFGAEVPVIIRYGYRCPELNEACGGSPTSAHLEGLAADMVFRGVDVSEAAHVLFQDPDFMRDVDQLIEERGCLHLGLPCKASAYKPRRQLRGDAFVNGKRTYPLVAVWTSKT